MNRFYFICFLSEENTEFNFKHRKHRTIFTKYEIQRVDHFDLQKSVYQILLNPTFYCISYIYILSVLGQNFLKLLANLKHKKCILFLCTIRISNNADVRVYSFTCIVWPAVRYYLPLNALDFITCKENMYFWCSNFASVHHTLQLWIVLIDYF